MSTEKEHIEAEDVDFIDPFEEEDEDTPDAENDTETSEDGDDTEDYASADTELPDDEDEDTDSEEDDDADESEDDQADDYVPPSQKQLSKIKKNAKQAKARAEKLMRENEELRKKLEKDAVMHSIAPPSKHIPEELFEQDHFILHQIDPISGEKVEEPNPEAFQTSDGHYNHAAYIKATNQYRAKLDNLEAYKKSLGEQYQKQQQDHHRYQQEVAQKAHIFQERARAVRDKYKDFDQAVSFANQHTFSEAMADAVVEHELGPQIAYLLAKNPKKAKEIGEKSTAQQIFEIAKLGNYIAGKRPSKKKKIIAKPDHLSGSSTMTKSNGHIPSRSTGGNKPV